MLPTHVASLPGFGEELVYVPDRSRHRGLLAYLVVDRERQRACGTELAVIARDDEEIADRKVAGKAFAGGKSLARRRIPRIEVAEQGVAIRVVVAEDRAELLGRYGIGNVAERNPGELDLVVEQRGRY